MPDPKVQAVVDEIQAILRKHDLAGVAFVASPTHTNYLLELTPSWVCMRMEGENTLRIRCKAADFPDKPAADAAMERTVGLVLGIQHACLQTVYQMEDLFKRIEPSLGTMVHHEVHEQTGELHLRIKPAGGPGKQ